MPIQGNNSLNIFFSLGAQWLSGRVLDSRPKGRGFEPHRRHCVVFLSKNINPSLVLVQPRKTRPYITEILLMGRKELNQTNKSSSLEPKVQWPWDLVCSIGDVSPTRFAQMMNLDLDLFDAKAKFDSLCIYIGKFLKCSFFYNFK